MAEKVPARALKWVILVFITPEFIQLIRPVDRVLSTGRAHHKEYCDEKRAKERHVARG